MFGYVGKAGCHFSMCCAQDCKQSVCMQHGDGKGYWEEDVLGSDVYFKPVRCSQEGCKVAYCSKHEQHMQECDVCMND